MGVGHLVCKIRLVGTWCSKTKLPNIVRFGPKLPNIVRFSLILFDIVISNIAIGPIFSKMVRLSGFPMLSKMVWLYCLMNRQWWYSSIWSDVGWNYLILSDVFWYVPMHSDAVRVRSNFVQQGPIVLILPAFVGYGRIFFFFFFLLRVIWSEKAGQHLQLILHDTF